MPRPEATLATPPAALSAHEWRIATSGVLFEGECVRVGWPEEDEFDAITALRNRPEMRGNFLDSRALDPVRNRAWLRHGMKRPYEAVLAIRMKHDDSLVGAIGWSHGDPVERSMELGRVMVDARKAIMHRALLPASYAGVALDAGRGARDFAFTMLNLNLIRMHIVDGNRLSLSAACAGGGRIVGTETAKRADGSEVKLIRLECSRDDWLRARQQEDAEAAVDERKRQRVPRMNPEATTSIPLFKPFVSAASKERLAATIEAGWLGYGPQCRELEQRFTARRGGWALSTSSCTSALFLAGRVVHASAAESTPNCSPEIIVPAISFVASGMAFMQAGVRPVVADVTPKTLLLDPDSVLRSLSPRTRAVLVVHLYGQRHPEMAALREICDRRGLLLIEDCAHRIDLLDRAVPLGDLTCYSFNAVKELPGGEGGLIWGHDPRHENLVRAVSNLGLKVDTMQRSASLQHADYAFASDIGLKLRNNDLSAALVNGGIESLAACRKERAAQCGLYDRLLAPLAPHVVPIERSGDDSFLMYVIRVAAELRESIRGAMAGTGVATSVHYPSLARHPVFGNASVDASCLGQDERVVTLPTYAALGADDQHRVVDALAEALSAALAKPPRAEHLLWPRSSAAA